MKFRFLFLALILLLLVAGCGQSPMEKFGDHDLYIPKRNGTEKTSLRFTFSKLFTPLLKGNVATVSAGEKEGEVALTLTHEDKPLHFIWQEFDADDGTKGLLLTSVDDNGKIITDARELRAPLEILGKLADQEGYGQLDPDTKQFIDSLKLRNVKRLKFICIMDQLSPKTLEMLKMRAAEGKDAVREKYSKDETAAAEKEIRTLMRN